MAKFRISRRADSDLDAIWDYVARDSVEAADKVEADIHSEIKRLAEMPGMGHERDDVRNPRIASGASTPTSSHTAWRAGR
jgi:plasmid stabilization system protein ParE